MTADPLPGIDTHLDPATPSLPGHLDGILARDPWTLICRDCGITSTARSLVLAIDLAGLSLRFMGVGWPDGTNPRLCADCRTARCRQWAIPEAWAAL